MYEYEFRIILNINSLA